MGVCTSCGANVADDEMQEDTCADCAGVTGGLSDKESDGEDGEKNEE